MQLGVDAPTAALRVHFFFIVALMTMLHGFHIVDFGANGWVWFGLVIIAGSGALWFVTERVWGKCFLPSVDLRKAYRAYKQ